MISINVEGANELSRLLKRKAKVYRSARVRMYAKAKQMGLKITQDQWFGIPDDNDVSIKIEDIGNGFNVVVAGTQVLFLEFGTGITYSSLRHPYASNMGYGPGTYPGKGYWDSPDGWFFETNDVTLATSINEYTGKRYAHTYGNPAYAPTYHAAMTMNVEFREMMKKELLK